MNSSLLLALPWAALIALLPACGSVIVNGDSSAGGAGGGGGAPNEAPGDPCEDGRAFVASCGYQLEDIYHEYRGALNHLCGKTEESRCKARCIAEGACADLQIDGDFYDIPLCEANDTSFCLAECMKLDCDTPLVLSFDSGPIAYVPYAQYGQYAQSDLPFDLGGGDGVVTDWPTAATPWLAMDRNGNGIIDDGSELFGSASRLRDGTLASNGFVALGELDSNGDGAISATDEAWPRLLVWSDRDGNRVSSAGELAPLGCHGVVSIELGYRIAPRCDERGNCEVERAGFRYDDGGGGRTGSVVDVHLRRWRRAR